MAANPAPSSDGTRGAAPANSQDDQATSMKEWLGLMDESNDQIRIPTGHTISEPDAIRGENERTYHGYRPGRYFLPNDGAEQDRLDLQHQVFRILLDGALTLAPIPKNPPRVLDIATGTGIWALDFGTEHPDSQVIGTDLSLIQPPNHSVANCTFVREDSEEPWTFDRPFDYIHLRAVCTCFSDTPAVIRTAYDNLNPGGWIEFQDIIGNAFAMDGELEGTVLQRYCGLFRAGFARMGRDMDKPARYKQWLVDAGFVDVVERQMPAPLNPWPKNEKFHVLGRYGEADFGESIRSVAAKLLPAAGVAPDEAREIAEGAFRDLQNQNIRSYTMTYFVYGRKPTAQELSAKQ